MTKLRRLTALGGLAAIAITTWTGCAYRLHPVSLPSQHTLKLAISVPSLYSVRVQGKLYPVAADGTVTFEYPAFRRGDSVYLFNLVPINRPADPRKSKTISITRGADTIQTLSLRDLSNLPVDSHGNPVLNLASRP